MHRSPKIRLIGKLQACGHHAPHGKALSIQSDRLSHNVWVGAKSARPQAVTEQHNILVARKLFLRRKYPPKFRRHAQQGKQACSSRGAGQSFRNAAPGQIRSLASEGGDLVKDLILLLPLDVVRIRSDPGPENPHRGIVDHRITIRPGSL